ncbi:hypothetical protein GF406_05490 [candidate division KSB1 bacterium]|nr:hypothetical protein [candidate division KSB1 bacterium]
MNEGVNFEEEKENRRTEHNFSEFYTEHHAKTHRVSKSPEDGGVVGESREEQSIQSDGERGRTVTISHQELLRCDCGCLVDSILKTRRDKAGNIFCEKHQLYCNLCSCLIMPEAQVRIGSAFYHRACGLRVIEKILDEDVLHPKLSSTELGELKAIRSDISSAVYRENFQKAVKFVKKLFERKKKKWLTKGEKMKGS